MANYIEEIRSILTTARQNAYNAVNAAMVEAYWLIGKRIVEQEQHGEERAVYGEGILKELSKALTTEFGKGFSYSNLRNFRQFYLTYRDNEICYTLCSKLTWSHNRLIMRVENEAAREFYLNEAADQNWNVRTLERNINTFYYHRLLSSKCFVLIDLKAGKLTHQHVGQMDMYRRMFDDLKKPEGDNPTIGIILCTEKSETVVKYSVINDNPRLFATKYMPYLPTEAELIAEIEREKVKLNLFNN